MVRPFSKYSFWKFHVHHKKNTRFSVYITVQSSSESVSLQNGLLSCLRSEVMDPCFGNSHALTWKPANIAKRSTLNRQHDGVFYSL